MGVLAHFLFFGPFLDHLWRNRGKILAHTPRRSTGGGGGGFWRTSGAPRVGATHPLLEKHIVMVYLRYTYCSMKGHNICNWTRVGEIALCGKSCCGTYCKIHLFKIRKGSKIPAPCRSCGRGVQSDIQLCRACGRDKVRHQHIALEKRARHQFSLVLAKLISQSETPI